MAALAGAGVLLATSPVGGGAQGVGRRGRDPVRVCVGGDVTLGTNLDTTWATKAARHSHRRVVALPDPMRLVAPLRPLFRDADVALVNVEGAIGEGPAPSKCPSGKKGCFALRQPPGAAQAIRSIAGDGEVVGNLANNHARDAGIEGLAQTESLLVAASVHVTGTDTLATTVATPRGDTVAFLGFSAGSILDARDLDAVRRHVARAAARYPRLVVTMHLGAEGRAAQRTRDTMELYLAEKRGNPVAFAHAAVAAGARLVVGHGPHVVRGVEWRDGALIAYSLGNLVTYGPFSLRPPLDRGGILCASIDDSGRVDGAVLRPTRQWPPGFVAADRRARAVTLADSLSRLDFPGSAATFVPEAAVGRPRARRQR
ncbi:MAG TPA: CapA family protein [Gemmatimonadaceae bacterium]